MRIKCITVATQDTPHLQALIRSAKRCGMDLTVLGMGETWQGFGMKIILTRGYLKTLEGYTHFIFVDAYDTLFLKHIDEVPDYPLFSTEKQCWPDASKAGQYPEGKTQWKFLNSGCYSSPIKKYLELVDRYPVQMSDDDQGYFTHIFLHQVIGSYKIDYDCKLFQSFAFNTPGDFIIKNGQLTNNITQTQPAIIHFNGKCHDKTIYDMVEYSTLQECQERWQNTEEKAKEINEAFIQKVNSNERLNEHRTFVENHVFGFGERSFHWMWKLIVDDLPKSFSFLEIGVLKGQTLSLVKMLADMAGKKVTRYGVTPLNTEGGVWESDYKKDIEFIHDKFELTKDYKLLVGLSEDPAIIKQASKLKLDVLYIDGGHEERHVVNDIENYSPLVKVGGYMVIDDCCNTFAQPFGYFCGIEAVTRVVDRMLPPVTPSSEWEFVFSVVHNRVYRKIS